MSAAADLHNRARALERLRIPIDDRCGSAVIAARGRRPTVLVDDDDSLS